MKLYLNFAPYGGNIYGYKSASLRYFGKDPKNLTWAEAATIAVLPNTPGIISPMKETRTLENKRNKLLEKLYKRGIIDQTIFEMSLKEEIPSRNNTFETVAPQFCEYVKKNSDIKYGIIKTTLNLDIQKLVERITQNHSLINSLIGINNASVVVIDVETSEVKAWIGSQDFYDIKNSGQVDGVISPRSTGSVLKPFLYALGIDRGMVLPDTLIPDIPTNFGSYSPLNSDGKFNGMVTVKDALTRALNVPAVRLLSKLGVDNFYRFLKNAGLKNLFRNSEEYGLTLILGGAEASLFEISSLYLGLARYGEFVTPKVIKDKKNKVGISKRLLSEGASFLVLEMLKEVNRPNDEQLWEEFSSLSPIAWKIGTSYGYKDAWAIGVSPSYVVGVWCGNFDGTPNVMLSGSRIAGSLMLDIFRGLPKNSKKVWFTHPYKKLTNIEICAKTGYTAGPFCSERKMVEAPVDMIPLPVCPYHTVIYTTLDGKYEVCSACWEPGKYTKKFILNFPAQISQFIRDNRLLNEFRPPHNPNCSGNKKTGNIDIIYPISGITIVVPRDFDGNYQKIIFKSATANKNTILFWYLNGVYITQTQGINNINYLPPQGENILTIVDGDSGETKAVRFNVIYASNN